MRRVCYIGSFTGPTDEGMRNVADSVLRTQAQHCEVLGVNPSSILFHPNRLKSFRPDILHYLSGPTILSLALLTLARMETACKRTVVTATHPWLLGMRLLPAKFKPELVIAQSTNQMKLLEELFGRIVLVPNGVDLQKFKPMETGARKAMRSSMGIAESDFVVLHVGNLRTGRNLEVLARLNQTPRLRAILVSSTTVGHRSAKLAKALRTAGVFIIEDFVPRIQDFYGISDCYVFPTMETGRAIEIPLSVLEAMACNVPVVCTPFGGLPDVLTPNKWLRFAWSPEDIENRVLEIRQLHGADGERCTTRDQALPLSWESIIDRMNYLYDELTNNDAVGQTPYGFGADGR